MKNISLILLLFAMSGCNQSSDVSAARHSNENGWTPGETDEVINICKSSIIDSGKFTLDYANTYCSCIYEEIIPTWSYSELQQNEHGIIAALTDNGVVASCLQAADQQVIESGSKLAIAAGMPDGFFGVKIGATAQEVRSRKPRIREESWGFEDAEDLNGKTYNVSYAVNPFSNSVFSISLERQASQDAYMATNAYLDNEFGPLSVPVKSAPWHLRSERAAGGIKLIHVLSDSEPNITAEKIILQQANE